MRGDCGVGGEGRVVGVPKLHSWGKCTMTLTNLASQPYFSLFPVGGARGREKYVWTLWPAVHATKECNSCVQQLQVTHMV